MITNIDNGSITGKAYPASLAEAYEVARLWAIPSQKKAVTTSLALVATEDSSRMKSGGAVEAVGQVVAAQAGNEEEACQRKGAHHLGHSRRKFDAGKVDIAGWVVPAGCEPDSKTCRGCLKKGHIWANCPDRVTTEKVLVGQDEDDWQSDDEDDQSTFMISTAKKRDREAAMFLSEEILLDNQASQCIFHNESLLHGVVGRDPYTMCGIDGGQSGLQVDRTGRISGFQKIGATVGLAGKASANILAQARLVDTDSTPMIFTRREGAAAEAGKELLS